MRIISLTIAALALLLLAFPAFAKPDNPGRGQGHGGNPPGTDVSSSQSGDNGDNSGAVGRLAASDVDCAGEAETHGQYVSCVAHGGDPESGLSLAEADGSHGSVVSDAAHSDIGTNGGDNDGDNSD